MSLSLILLSVTMFLNVMDDKYVKLENVNPFEERSLQEYECVTNAYPPPESSKIPEFTIDLDLPPEERWQNVTAQHSKELHELLLIVKNFIGKKLFKVIDDYGPKLLDTLPYPFADEMRGVANASQMSLGEVALYNVFYEIFTVCTSIVAQTPSGHLIHGRNLDFGLFLGWDSKNHTWLATDVLRRMSVKLNFQRQGKTLFRSTSFAGYVGILTAMKPQSFSLTVDERFKIVGGYVGIIKWILGKRSGHWMSFLTRSVMENATSYYDAKTTLANSELLAPVYFILGGNHTEEACVITRGLDSVDIWDIGIKDSSWYLVETNYDHWNKPPFFDDRRHPAKLCLDRIGYENMSFTGLFNVLSTKPVLNKLTAYSTLMDVIDDKMESYKQFCVEPCPII